MLKRLLRRRRSVAQEATVAAAVDANWEPVKPTVGQAQEAYQILLELCRQHPDDIELANALECARDLRDAIWKEYNMQMRSQL